ncbi:MAG: hypothetical protein R2752_16470 [Vicinamibacterales bacterium]
MASIDQHRQWSGLTAAGAALAMLFIDGVGSAVVLCCGLCLPLTLIWFAEPLGQFVGRVGYRHINRESPPELVRALGWLGLIVLSSAILFAVARTLRGA